MIRPRAYFCYVGEDIFYVGEDIFGIFNGIAYGANALKSYVPLVTARLLLYFECNRESLAKREDT